VQDAAEVTTTFGLEYLDRVGVGLPRVDHHGPADLARQPELHAEHFALDVARCEVVVIVEPDLPHGPGTRRDRELIAHQSGGSGRIVRESLGGVRMYPDGESHVRPELRHAVSLSRFARVSSPEDHQSARHAGGPRPRDHRVKVVGEHRVGQVAV